MFWWMSFQYIPIHPRRMGKEKDEWDDLSCVFSMPQPIGRRSKKMFDVLDSASFEMADFYYRERSHTIEYRIITLSHSTKTVMLVYIIYSSMLVKKRKKKRNEMFGYCHIFRDILSLLSTILCWCSRHQFLNFKWIFQTVCPQVHQQSLPMPV